MELRVYNEELDFQGITENQTSLIWRRRYYEPGDFQVYLPLTDDNVRLYKLGNIVFFREATEAGVIEDVSLRATSVERVVVASGRFLSSYMDRRLIRPTVNFSGKVETAMRQLLTNAVAIPRVTLGEFHDFPETVTFQATYKGLLDYETKLSKSSNIGFRFKPDFTNKVIYFETYKGVDRTRGQSERAFVEFSDKFDNLNEFEDRKNSQLLKNVGYVGGEGEGSDRTYVTVGDDALVGLERREVFIDARDLSSDDLTQEQYLDVLRNRGYEKMAEMILSDAIDCSTIPQGNFTYRKDYDLGDIVTVRKTDWGISLTKRITEISEVYEHGSAVIALTLGEALPTKVDWEDK